MSDTIIATLPIEAADSIVVAWLEESLKIIEATYYGENEGCHMDDEDYQAMQRILVYLTGVEE